MITPFKLNMVCIAEHWLNLVIAMVGERFTDGVGMITMKITLLKIKTTIEI